MAYIVKKLNFHDKIKQVEIEGLQLTLPKKRLSVELRLRVREEGGEVVPVIWLCDTDTQKHGCPDPRDYLQILLERPIPESCIFRGREFLVHSDVLKSNDFEDFEDLWWKIAAQLICKFQKPKVTLYKESKGVVAILSMDSFQSEGSISLAKAKEYFLPT